VLTVVSTVLGVEGILDSVEARSTKTYKDWKEAEAVAVNSQEWRQSVAQCIHVEVC